MNNPKRPGKWKTIHDGDLSEDSISHEEEMRRRYWNEAIDAMTAYQKEREAWGLDGLKKVKEKLIDRAEKTHYPLENLSYNEIAEIIREVKETLNRFSEVTDD